MTNSSIHAPSRMPKYYAALNAPRAIALLEQRTASYKRDDSLRFWFRSSRGSRFGLGGNGEFNFAGFERVILRCGVDDDEIADGKIGGLGRFVFIVGPHQIDGRSGEFHFHGLAVCSFYLYGICADFFDRALDVNFISVGEGRAGEECKQQREYAQAKFHESLPLELAGMLPPHSR